MVKKARSPRLNEFRDPVTFISTENHQQMFRRLIEAGLAGMHGRPGPRKPHKSD